MGIPGQSDNRFDGPDHGGVRVLLEGKFSFDVIDMDSDLDSCKLVILPDLIEVDDALKSRIDAYVAKGGRVLLTGKSGLRDGAPLFDVGAEWHGTSDMTGAISCCLPLTCGPMTSMTHCSCTCRPSGSA